MFGRESRSVLVLGAAGAVLCFGQVNVLTYHNDNARTGQNVAETILTPATVNAAGFGKLFSFPMDGKVDAQPLYVSGVVIPGQGTYNVVYAASEHDSVYAFDANSGKPFWQVSLLGAGETTSDIRNCGQVAPEIGVTATPVIDLNAGPHGTIYLVAMSKDLGGNYYQRLHALDIATGTEEFNGPTTVQASYPGSGANSSNGQVIFDAKQYKDRAGLLLLNGVVYTSWGSHCDIQPYTGWIIGYNEATLQQTSVFNFDPNGTEGALWNSGGGPAADAQGNIFAAVANGTFDTVLTPQGFPSSGDYGNAFVKLTPQNGSLSPADYWTMSNSNTESASDTDLGSGSVVLLPDETDSSGTVRHLAVGAGKDSNLYVIDRDNMGKYDPTANATIYQQLSGALPGGIFSNPAYFNGNVYFGPVGSAIYDFQISSAKLSMVSATGNLFGYPGATPSISAQGTINGILWAVENSNPAVLHAYDATDLGVEYYNSSQAASARDQFGPGNKYITPTIAGGQVFVGTTTGVTAFSILPKPVLPNGQYLVINQLSNLVLDDPAFETAYGTLVIEFPLNYGANQEWTFTSNGGGFYTIANTANGLLLADPGGLMGPGAPLLQETADGTDAQLWSLTVSGSGYVIRNKASGLVIDDTNWSFQPWTGMQLWSPLGNSNQAWLLQ